VTLSSVCFWANTYLLVLGFSADFLYIKYVYRKSNRESGGGNYRDDSGGGGGCNAPFCVLMSIITNKTCARSAAKIH
jgi:hypothetical protein